MAINNLLLRRTIFKTYHLPAWTDRWWVAYDEYLQERRMRWTFRWSELSVVCWTSTQMAISSPPVWRRYIHKSTSLEYQTTSQLYTCHDGSTKYLLGPVHGVYERSQTGHGWEVEKHLVYPGFQLDEQWFRRFILEQRQYHYNQFRLHMVFDAPMQQLQCVGYMVFILVTAAACSGADYVLQRTPTPGYILFRLPSPPRPISYIYLI